MDAWVVNCILGFAIGLSLGFLGGGGSILTVPALVYVVGQSPQAAVSASLIIVGSNAAMGALFHNRRCRDSEEMALNWQVALLFGGVGMLTSYLAAGLSQLVSPTLLMILFALLMLFVGTFMVVNRRGQRTEGKGDSRGWAMTIVSGAAVGALTGFLGVGGGFLIVPALVMLVGLPVHQAVGTSLVVIAMNSLAGLLGHLAGASFDITVITTFVAAGFVGAFAGARLSHFLKPDQLRTSFAVFVMILAIFLLVDNVGKLL